MPLVTMPITVKVRSNRNTPCVGFPWEKTRLISYDAASAVFVAESSHPKGKETVRSRLVPGGVSTTPHGHFWCDEEATRDG